MRVVTLTLKTHRRIVTRKIHFSSKKPKIKKIKCKIDLLFHYRKRYVCVMYNEFYIPQSTQDWVWKLLLQKTSWRMWPRPRQLANVMLRHTASLYSCQLFSPTFCVATESKRFSNKNSETREQNEYVHLGRVISASFQSQQNVLYSTERNLKVHRDK